MSKLSNTQLLERIRKPSQRRKLFLLKNNEVIQVTLPEAPRADKHQRVEVLICEGPARVSRVHAVYVQDLFPTAQAALAAKVRQAVVTTRRAQQQKASSARYHTLEVAAAQKAERRARQALAREAKRRGR